MSFNRIQSDKTDTIPVQETTAKYTAPVKRLDGREARKTGRTKQFNPRVTPQFMERFAEAKAEEASRLGEEIAQAYFLELLLATYERAHGHEAVRPFGLSEPAYDAAKAIADHMGWSLSAVIEDAIAARYKQFSIEKPAETRRR